MTTVTFKFEGSDPNHESGMTEDEFIALSDAIAQLGGFDMEIEKSD